MLTRQETRSFEPTRVFPARTLTEVCVQYAREADVDNELSRRYDIVRRAIAPRADGESYVVRCIASYFQEVYGVTRVYLCRVSRGGCGAHLAREGSDIVLTLAFEPDEVERAVTRARSISSRWLRVNGCALREEPAPQVVQIYSLMCFLLMIERSIQDALAEVSDQHQLVELMVRERVVALTPVVRGVARSSSAPLSQLLI